MHKFGTVKLIVRRFARRFVGEMLCHCGVCNFYTYVECIPLPLFNAEHRSFAPSSWLKSSPGAAWLPVGCLHSRQVRSSRAGCQQHTNEHVQHQWLLLWVVCVLTASWQQRIINGCCCGLSVYLQQVCGTASVGSRLIQVWNEGQHTMGR